MDQEVRRPVERIRAGNDALSAETVWLLRYTFQGTTRYWSNSLNQFVHEVTNATRFASYEEAVQRRKAVSTLADILEVTNLFLAEKTYLAASLNKEAIEKQIAILQQQLKEIET